MKLVYDLQSKPCHMEIEEFLYWVENKGIVWWDSSSGGQAPIITPESDLEIKDISKDLTQETL
jgi:hypothetical protein